MSYSDIDRLNSELDLLRRSEETWGISAARVARQLIDNAYRPLPDVTPPRPCWVVFHWPVSSRVDHTDYWRQVDRERKLTRERDWMGPYL